MKHTLIVIALFTAFGASAQDTSASATSNAGSASQSGAQSGSIAAGNVIVLEQNVPAVQTINYDQTVNTNTNSTARVENVQSGTSTSRVEYSGTQTVKNVPGIAMSGPASGPCTGASGGLGLAGPGWGVGFNGAKVEPSCVVRENTRVLGMAMQSLDGVAYPQQKGELMIMMMDAARGLAAMNMMLINEHVKAPK